MSKTRCGFVALIGAPNVGKSTLTNALVGTKVSIVTQKVQTTRARVMGIAVRDQSQIILVDTPGIFKPKRRLDRAMVNAAWGSAEDADIICFLVDARTGLRGETGHILENLKKSGKQAVLVINKVDLVKKEMLLALVSELHETGLFTDVFMVSALRGDGIDDLLTYLAKHVPEGPWHYPEDQVADITERLMAAEITREKVYLNLHQELPYAISIETQSFADQDDGSLRIEQNILVTRQGHKGIVIGKGGQTLKKIGAEARQDMQSVFGKKVHLFLYVKVAEKWGDDPHHYREIGLDYVN